MKSRAITITNALGNAGALARGTTATIIGAMY